MKEDDADFFKLTREAHLPMIISTLSHQDLASVLFDDYHYDEIMSRDEEQWRTFYPINKNHMLVPINIDNLFYSIEVNPIKILDCIEKNEKYFINKVKKELKQIMSGREKFYFKKVKGMNDYTQQVKELGEAIIKDNPKLKLDDLPFTVFQVNKDYYGILGTNKAQVSRAMIFIINKVK